MPTLTATLDQLRGRFHRCRYERTVQEYEAIALEMGLTRPTLYRFAKGGVVAYETLLRVERWCDKEEGVPGNDLGKE